MRFPRLFRRNPEFKTAPPETPPVISFQRPQSPRELTESELVHIGRTGTCPFCRGDLYGGPEGGMCVNLLCRSEGCWSRFNYCGWVGQYVGRERMDAEGRLTRVEE